MKRFTLCFASLALSLVTAAIVIVPVAVVIAMAFGGIAAVFNPYYAAASGLGSLVGILTLGWFLLIVLLWVGYYEIMAELLIPTAPTAPPPAKPSHRIDTVSDTKPHADKQGKWGQTGEDDIVVP